MCMYAGAHRRLPGVPPRWGQPVPEIEKGGVVIDAHGQIHTGTYPEA